MFCSAENPKVVLQKMMGSDFLKIKGGMFGEWNFTKDNLKINAVLGIDYNPVYRQHWIIL